MAWIVSAGLSLAACRSPEGVSLAEVSTELEARAGHGLAVDATDDLPPDVLLGDGLDEGEAVAIALWRSPAFALTLAELELSRAELAEAGLLRDPVLSFLFPFGPKQYEWTLSIPLEALWQRPRRIALAELDLERTAAELVSHGLDLALEVRLACAEAVAAEEREHAAGEQRALAQELVRITGERLRSGDASPAELERARMRASEAALESLQLAGARRAAQLELEARIGLELDQDIALRCAGTPAWPEDGIGEEQLLAAARTARPEVRAAELELEAAAQGAHLAQAEVWKVSALLDANEDGSEGFELGPGLALPLPLLSWGRTGSARARARLEQAALRRLATGARVRAEVRAASARHASSLELLHEHDERVRESEHLLQLARVAHELGDSEPTEWVERELAALAARREEIELRATCRRARAELERSLGCRLDHVPGPAEDRGSP